MKHIKPETAAEKRAYNKWVKEQLEKYPRCVVYPVLNSTQIHHIARGVHRRSALMEPCATVPVSQMGHRTIEGWPIEKQLACKLTASHEHAAEVDLLRFNMLRDRAPEAITFMDLVPFLTLRESV